MTIKIDINESIHLYENEKLTLKKIGEKYDCSHTTIRNKLIKAGVKLRKQGRGEISIPISVIIHLYKKEQLTLKEIGKKYNCNYNVIRNRLIKAGVKIRDCGYRKNTVGKKDEIIERYKNGETVLSIAEQLKCSTFIIRYHLRKNGVVFRRKLPSNKVWTEEKVNELKKDYEDLGSFRAVAEKYGVSRQRVHQLLMK